MLVGISICDKGIFSILDVLQSGEWKYNSIKSNNIQFDYNLHLD